MALPPIKIGFRLWLLKFPYSFSHFKVCVCGWGMCLQNLYQWNERDERGKWRTWFFSKKKALPFHTKKWLHFLGPLRVFIVWWLLILSPLPCLIALCVCVCALTVRKAVIGAICWVQRSFNSRPICTLRSRDDREVHIYTLRQTPATWTTRAT